MKPILVSVTIDAPREKVWDDISRLVSHVEWMSDAKQIDFVSEQTSGIGTVMEVETRIGPLRTTDRIEVVEWNRPGEISVIHTGLFSGEGTFALDDLDGNRTRFSWQEAIRFPWYLGGKLGALAARPILRRVWRRNLEALQRRFSPR